MAEIKRKRVMTRIGDLFCVELDVYKVYLQFIAVDYSYLNSTTIRVFKKKYPINEDVHPDEIVKGEVDFYAHTALQPGLKDGTWTKVGKHKDIGDVEKVLFRNTDAWPAPNPKVYKWWVGGINKEYSFIGELTEEYRNKTDDAVFVPPIDIVERITTGKYRGEQPY